MSKQLDMKVTDMGFTAQSKAFGTNTVAFPMTAERLADIEHISQIRLVEDEPERQFSPGYCNTGRAFTTMSHQEESESVGRAHSGDRQARNGLTLANMGLVVRIAKRYQNCGVPMSDLVQEGSIGLMTAVRKFDRKRGLRLSTYAVWWIREAINRALSNKSRMIRLPIHVSEVMSKIRRARTQLSIRNGCDPLSSDIALEIGESIVRVEHVLISSRPCFSLDQHLSSKEQEDLTLCDIIPDSRSNKAEENVSTHYLRSEINELLGSLDERERQIVQIRFGLIDGQERSLREIGTELGLTRDQVGKLSSRAMRKLRQNARIEQFEAYLN
ncbi:MAG: sigma-70 family RNA polymerase sigma factor [Candidatus Obscuribacterales bacterium]|nr:sigma-70 family RNA polymerase sigma factor [Candidatus Obscuribacterales bacterium]